MSTLSSTMKATIQTETNLDELHRLRKDKLPVSESSSTISKQCEESRSKDCSIYHKCDSLFWLECPIDKARVASMPALSIRLLPSCITIAKRLSGSQWRYLPDHCSTWFAGAITTLLTSIPMSTRRHRMTDSPAASLVFWTRRRRNSRRSSATHCCQHLMW